MAAVVVLTRVTIAQRYFGMPGGARVLLVMS